MPQTNKLSSIIDKAKFYQLGIAIFGVFSVYVIHNVIYEKLIMSPFLNSATLKSQYFHSEAGFVFLQKTLAWLFAQILGLCTISNNKKSQTRIPLKYAISSGFFVFLSSILFTTGIFQLSFRLSFSNRTSTYLVVTLIGYVISPYTSPSRSPKFYDIFPGLGIGFGVILFWMCGQDLWVYTPTKNGYIYNWMVVSSGICDGILALILARISEKFNPNALYLLRNVSRCTALWSFFYVFIVGNIRKTFEFCYFHQEWTMNVLTTGFLYFFGQILIYRVTIKMSQNVPGLVTTSRKVLTIHQSYMCSSHKVQGKQLIGMGISWISILIQAFMFVKRQKHQRKFFQKVPRFQVQMSPISKDHYQVQKH